MAMPFQPWRAALQPASFAGCGFHVEVGSRPGGRRLAVHEYTITITEFSPFMAGISRAGDTRPAVPLDPTDVEFRWQVGPPEIRFWWRVNILGAKTRWFRAGTGQAGIDPMVRIGLATDLECLIRRWKPAHTDVVFSYARAGQQVVSYTWFRAGLGQAGHDPMLAITAQGGIADT